MSAFEVGFRLWETTPELTKADVPANAQLVVPDEVFSGCSLEEVLLERRERQGEPVSLYFRRRSSSQKNSFEDAPLKPWLEIVNF
jgi:hypothetical protein